MNQHNNVISLVESKDVEAVNLPISTPSPAPPVEVEVEVEAVEKVEKLVKRWLQQVLHLIFTENLQNRQIEGGKNLERIRNEKRIQIQEVVQAKARGDLHPLDININLKDLSFSRPSSSSEKYETATEAVAPPKSQPGDSNWSYIDDPIDLTLVNMLVPFWDRTENL